MPIRKLSPSVIQQIAAGEVIERPASVLKELLENSIDAQSREIKVQTEGGGLHRLCVKDDGEGISKEDLSLVFEPHATSKFSKIEDFDELHSMGFRGEAMSVLGHCADVKISTATKDSDTAWQARQSFGQWKGVEEIDARVGTEVEVVELFQNLPVRQKFLKSPSAETRRLLEVWKRYALCYPDIRWSFEDKDRDRLIDVPAMSRKDRVMWFYEATRPEHWWEAEGEEGEWTCHFVGLKPRHLRASRTGLQIFLNQRPIKDRSLEFAIRRSLEGYTETPQWAMGALFLEGPPRDFDVNVHPTKMEVRFKDADQIFSIIVHAARPVLESMHRERQTFNWTPPQASREIISDREAFTPSSEAVSAPSKFSFGETPSRVEAHKPSSQNFSRHTVSVREELSAADGISATESLSQNLKSAPSQMLAPGLEAPFSYRYLGSIDDTYLIAKRERSLFLFDQHALHERVLYEELKKQREASKAIPKQRLLFPVRLEFDGVEELLEKEEELELLGFELRQWSGGVQLLSIPAVLRKGAEAALHSLKEVMAAGRESLMRDTLATLACHSAIRAHDALEPEEAQRLLDQFGVQDALGHCPHGRPTYIELRGSDLEKFFHRA